MSDGIEYFETGCLCVLSGKIPQGQTWDYYMANCNCSRHPESAKMECWDRNENLRKKALETIQVLHPDIFES